MARTHGFQLRQKLSFRKHMCHRFIVALLDFPPGVINESINEYITNDTAWLLNNTRVETN